MMMLYKAEQQPLEEIILEIQQGDKEKLEYLLKDYQPFIAKTVSQVCKRYIDQRTDDEFSVGLYAMNEAVFLYCPDKKCSFLSFAKLIIKSKVIDYIRYQSRRAYAVSLDEYFDSEKMENPAEISEVKKQYFDELNTRNLREEMIEYKEELHHFKLSLSELRSISPKHRDAQITAKEIARILVNDDELKKYVLLKKKLPIKMLKNKVTVSRKTLERNRKYILAVFIVLNGDYTYLKEYVKEDSF